MCIRDSFKHSRLGYTHVNPHIIHDTNESTPPLLDNTWDLVVTWLCFTPQLVVHGGIHTRRACVRTSQCHFFIVSHRFFWSVVLTSAELCYSVTSTSGNSCNLAVHFDISRRQKTVSKHKRTFFCAVLARSLDNSVTLLAPLFSGQAYPQPNAADHMPSTTGSTAKVTIPSRNDLI